VGEESSVPSLVVGSVRLAIDRKTVMPKLAGFDGLVVKLFFNDHPPPHFHVYAGRIGHPGVQAARFSIETGAMTDGKLPPAKLPKVTSWWEEHRDALDADWQRAQLGQHPTGRYH
jgi:hypothetical protein